MAVESHMPRAMTWTQCYRENVLKPDPGETIMSTEALIRGKSSINWGCPSQFAPAIAPAFSLCRSRLAEVLLSAYAQLSKWTLSKDAVKEGSVPHTSSTLRQWH
jgi:hypothetical protein